MEELRQYQHAIMTLLGKVEIEGSDQKMKEDLKSAYKLLSYLSETELDKSKLHSVKIRYPKH